MNRGRILPFAAVIALILAAFGGVALGLTIRIQEFWNLHMHHWRDFPPLHLWEAAALVVIFALVLIMVIAQRLRDPDHVGW